MTSELQMYRAVTDARRIASAGFSAWDACLAAGGLHDIDANAIHQYVDQAISGCEDARQALIVEVGDDE